jgi:hypothetical protein
MSAVDGLVDSAGSAAYPTLAHDITKGPVCTRVDLVYCHEVVEHIEELYLDNLLPLAQMLKPVFRMLTIDVVTMYDRPR